MIHLPQVTLLAVTGLDYQVEETLEALQKSQESIRFGEVLYLRDEKITDIDSWNKYIIYDVPEHIRTDFALLIHADGYVINPESWNDDWLNYDYIGSPWPLPQDDFSYRDKKGEIIRVGNSVSLRSKRLLDVPIRRKLEWKPFHGYYNEDGFICVNYRHIYEEEGCRFAPLEVAKYFGKEHEIPENKEITKPFVFHDI